MEITYLGHSAFKIKGKNATVITDPYSKSVGFSLPKLSADIVTMSHGHDDHNAFESISGTARREKPYVVSAPGEYEVGGVGVFGWSTFHDDKNGELRGKNTVYSILIDGFRVVHLGDLGHELSDSLKDNLGVIDILLIPVGGVFTISPQVAVKVINQIQPSVVIPMHYKTESHASTYAELVGVEEFLKEWGSQNVEAKDSYSVASPDSFSEETEIVVLKAKF